MYVLGDDTFRDFHVNHTSMCLDLHQKLPSNMLKPSSNFLTDRSKAVILLLILLSFMFRVCLCHTVLFVPYSFVATCWERAALFALLCEVFSCVRVTFPYT